MNFKKFYLLKMTLCFLLICLLSIGELALTVVMANDEDYLTEVYVDYDRDYLKWDSKYGPLYELCLSTGELLQCTSEDAKIINYSYEDNIVQVTVYSAELPEETSYTMDLTDTSQYKDTSSEESNILPDEITEDYVTFCEVDKLLGILHFDSALGPDYVIDMNNKTIIQCSADDMYLDKP